MDKYEQLYEEIEKIIFNAKKRGLISSNAMSIILTEISIAKTEIEIPTI